MPSTHEKRFEKLGNLCNLCGLTCMLEEAGNEGFGGAKVAAIGGYSSTPGNGVGALDDDDAYYFKLCEFCLDFLYANAKIPPAVYWGCDSEDVHREFMPAAERVAKDEWRDNDREVFFTEFDRRNQARKIK